MDVFSKEKIRNIALIGHSGEGKTSLLEAILFNTKAIDRLGKIDDGNTVSDYEAEETSRKMSISLTLSYALYKDYKINFLDCPGFFDFEGEMIAALSVADGAIIVTQASGYLSVGTEKAIDYCKENGVPMLIFVNGVNKENSSYSKTVNAIKEKYGTMVSPIELPIMDGYTMTGYVDVLANKAFDNSGAEIAIPSEFVDVVASENAELTEIAASADEELMEIFFDKGDLSKEEKLQGIKKMVVSTEFVPMVAGVAVGKPILGDLLDNIVSLMPSAGEKGNAVALRKEEKVEFNYDENAPFACRIFKTTIDPFVGKLLLFKVYSGTAKSGDIVTNTVKDETEKVSALYTLRGKSQEAMEVVKAGDIGAFAKMSYSGTNDTLCDSSLNVIFPPIDFPQPVFTVAISTEGEKGGTDKVVDGLKRLMEEDPTFRVEKNVETNETVISGVGETQIDVLCKKVKNKYKVEAKLVEPRVAYRETIRKTVEQQGRCKKQTGGSGLFGDVYIRFEPAPEIDFEFAEEVVGGAVPKQYFPSVEKGLREIKTTGILAGCLMTGFRAVLYFGSYHPVDSKEAAFIEAAKIAFREGMPKANPVLLEPIMNLRVVVPTEFMGDIMGDITKRKGKVFGMESENGKTVINGEVPQSEMHRYAIDLRSMTQGRGRFSMEFARYDDVPLALVPKIIEEERKKRGK